jgi:hypothetical protein
MKDTPGRYPSFAKYKIGYVVESPWGLVPSLIGVQLYIASPLIIVAPPFDSRRTPLYGGVL